jgi:hypothetical protein
VAPVFLIRFRDVERSSDGQSPRTFLGANVVQPKEARGAGSEPVEFETVNWWELQGRPVPAGPLDLRRYAVDGGPTWTVSDYKIGCILDGPVFLILSLDDCSFDASRLSGAIYSATGRDGVQQFDPFPDPTSGRFPDLARRLSLHDLGLTEPVIACLEAEGITMAVDLCVRSASDLGDHFPHLEENQIQEVRDRMAAVGLWLRDESPK